MRFIVLSCCLFILNCEDNESRKKSIPAEQQSKSNIDSDTIAPKPSDTTKKSDTIQFPVLTEDNAMDFFLEYEKENKENKVRLTTSFGDIDIQLHDKTKFHRANFIYLTKRHYFDSTQFYRVIDDFMVQAGSTDDIKIMRKRGPIGKYLLPRDTKRGYKHHRGAVSMPSSDIENPHKLASPYEFFIIQNPKGEYRLDGDYTVFGQVIRGMDVVDKIAAVETDDADWPLKNVYILKAEIID